MHPEIDPFLADENPVIKVQNRFVMAEQWEA